MKLPIGIIFVITAILGACHQNSTNTDSTPAPTNSNQANQSMPDEKSSTTQDDEKPNQQSILLKDGSKLVYSAEAVNAVLHPKELKLKLKRTLYSANWGFLPNPNNLQESCDTIRDAVETAMKNGEPRNSSAYSDILNREASYFTLERDIKSQIELAKQALLEKGLNKNLIIKNLKIADGTIQAPSLILSGETIPRDLTVLLNMISKYQNSSTQFNLTIGEICDLTAKESYFLDEEKFTKITFRF